MKKLIVFLLSFGVINGLMAQNFVGIRGGITGSTVSKFDLIQNITPTFKLHPSASGAIFYEMGVTEHFAFQPELAFTQKGFRIQESLSTATDFLGVNIPIGGRIDLRTSYLEVPLLAKFKFGNPKSAHYYFMIGPSVGVLANAGLTLRVLNIFPIRTDIPKSFFKPAEISGVAALGFSLPVAERLSIAIEGRYQQGFSRVLNTPIVRLPVRNSSYGVNMGFKWAMDNKGKNKLM